MRKRYYPVLMIAVVLFLLFLTSVAIALDTPQMIIRHVEGSAGQKVAAGSFVLDGTLGEPVAGSFVAAGGYKLASGYWKEITHNAKIFLPVVVK